MVLIAWHAKKSVSLVQSLYTRTVCLVCVQQPKRQNAVAGPDRLEAKPFLHKSIRLKWRGLIVWIVVSYPVTVYRNKCHRAYEKFGWHWMIWKICGVEVTSDIWSRVGWTRQQWSRYWFTDGKHGCWEQKICKAFWCLNTVDFAALVEYDGRIFCVTQKSGVR